MYKAWVCDFDGTVVGKNWVLSPAVHNAIEHLLKKGIIFSLASGRPYQGTIENFCKKMHLTAPQIAHGGARIIDPQTNQTLWEECISKKSAAKIISYLLENNIFLGAETETGIYTKDAKTTPEYGPDIQFQDIETIDYTKVLKIVAKTNPEQTDSTLKTMESALNDIHIIKAKSPTHQYFVLDITSQKATKHMAILKLSELLTIDPQNMVGVGDGYNDYPLLTACGYKIAMENAPQEVKDIADLVVPDVKNDGLAQAIARFV